MDTRYENLDEDVLGFLDAPEDEKQEMEAALLRGDRLPILRSYGVTATMPPEQIESIRGTYVAEGGNIAAVAATHQLSVNVVNRLAFKYEWPVYVPVSPHDHTHRRRLERIFEQLTLQVEEFLLSMEVEYKDIEDLFDKRRGSVYIESLTSRTGAFKTLFDMWTRVGEMLEPETFVPEHQRARSMAGVTEHLGDEAAIDRRIGDILGSAMTHVADEVTRRSLEQERARYDQMIDEAAEEVGVVDAEVVG